MTTAPVPYDALLEHAAFVRALARSLLKDEAAADDAVQATWLAAAKSPPRQAGKERSWLSKVVRNAVRQQRRSAGRRARREREAARPEVRPTTAPATDELAARDEIFRNVAGAVMALPEGYRAVVMLRFYDGLPPRKIAAKLGLPVETVRTRLKRAIVMLRTGLDDRYGGDRHAWQAALAPFAAGSVLFGGVSLLLVKVLALAAVVGAGLLVWRIVAPADTDPGTGEQASQPGAAIEAPAEPVGPPVLFGRASVPSEGPGGVIGRVLHLQTGAPVVGATLRLATTDEHDERIWALERHARADGTFHVRDVPSGLALSLTVAAPGVRTRTVPAFEVEAGAVLDLGTLWMGNPGRLEGRVVDGRGRGLGGAHVEVHPTAYPFATFPPPPELLLVGLDRPLDPLATTGTATDGSFGFDGLPAGPLCLVVRAPGFRQSVRRVVMTVDGPAGGPLEVRVVQTEPVYGRVVDGTGDAIGGARVALIPPLRMPSDFFARQIATTDAAGRFRFDAPPPTEEMTVVAAANGYPTWLEHRAGVTRSMRLVLDHGATIDMRVVDAASGRPLPNARLTLTTGEPFKGRFEKGFVLAAETDSDGLATVEAAPGTLQVLMLRHEVCGETAYSPIARGRPTALDLGDDADGRIEAGANAWTIRCAGGARFVGRVTGPGGAPLEGARCRTMGMGGASTYVLTDTDGRYVLRGSRKGMSLLLVEAAGFVQPRSTVMVMPQRDQEETVRDVEMERAARVEGRVVDRAGHPLAGVETMIVPVARAMPIPDAGAPKPSVTNADGRYAFDSVRPGGRLRVAGVRRGFVTELGDVFQANRDGTVSNAPDLVLSPGLVVTVKVETPEGRPAVDANVAGWVERARGLPPGAGLSAEGRMDVRTDEDGRATIVDLPAGTLNLVAALRGFGSATAQRTLDPDEPAGDEVVVRLTEAATIQGRVLDADGKAVPKVMVIVDGREGAEAGGRAMPTESWAVSAGAVTDAEGRFDLRNLPGPGRYGLRVVGPSVESERQIADTDVGEAVLRVTQNVRGEPDREELREALRRMRERLGEGERDDPDLRQMIQMLEELTEETGDSGGTER